MTPDELKAAWRAEREYYIALDGYRNGYRLFAPWEGAWRVVFWLEEGRAMARDNYTNGAPVVVEEGDGLAQALAR